MRQILFLLLLLFVFQGTLAFPAQPNIPPIIADDFGCECVTANGGESNRPDGPNWDPKARGEKANPQTKHFADMTAYMAILMSGSG